MRFSLLAFFGIALTTSFAATASELRWHGDRPTTTGNSLRTQAQSQTKAQTQTQSSAPTNSTSASALRFVRPLTSSTRHDDQSIRLAAFEDDAPRLTSGHAVETPTRSVVVNRDDATDSVRSAQLPAAGTANSQGTPFGDTPAEQPQLKKPDFETPPMPEADISLPPPQNNTSPAEQQRQLAQPPQNAAEQPAFSPTQPVGQFQPILPAGPNAADVSGPPAPAIPTATVEAEKVKAKESCDKSFENLRAYTVDKVNLNIAIKGTEGQDYPFECSIDNGEMFKGRCWEQTTYMWKASALCHKPLYFEDEQLERYGHSFSPCFQPFISGAHFFCTLPVLPYCMGVEPPCECIYALGYYRPGSCAPYMCNPIPLSPRGALLEAGAVTGAAMALP